MKIGELSARTGASVRALRYYEERGLLRPARGANGYRDYGEPAVRAVRRIQLLLAAGLPSPVVAELLPCVAGEEILACDCPEVLDALAEQRARLTASIDELSAARDILDSLLGAPLDRDPPARRPSRRTHVARGQRRGITDAPPGAGPARP
jgi:DNA-binding transcriptional MerR regulator